MTPSHLLLLSALHLAAPGVLDVVFGKDGKHDDAPYWTGPVLDVHPGGHRGFFHVTKILSGRFADVLEIAPMMDLHDLALDLRIPSVAARLAGLCARAMGHHQPATWSIQDERGGVFALVGVIHTPRTSFDSTIVLRWDRGRAMGYGSGGDAQHPSITTVTTDGGAFLRDLVLELAPKIAALP